MQNLTLVLFAAFVTVAYAGGQFYVPRAYYTIDSDGHESAPVPLRRLRRSVPPLYPYRNSQPELKSKTISTSKNNPSPYGQASGSARAYSEPVRRQPSFLPPMGFDRGYKP